MLRAYAFALVVLTLLVSGIASAQESGCRQRTIPLTVLNKKNDQVIDATRLRFQGFYRGKPIPVTAVTASEKAPPVLILFDLSGSVTSASQVIPNSNIDLSRARTGALLPSSIQTGFIVLERLLADLPSTTEVGLAVFASRMELLVRPTSNRKEVVDAARSLRQNLSDVQKRIGGSTALWDAIDESRKLLNNPATGDAIFVMSDGGDNLSKNHSKSVVTAVGASGIRLFFAPLQIFQSLSLGEHLKVDAAQAQMSEFSEAVKDTGGWTFAATGRRTTDAELNVQRRIVQVAHRLTIELPEAVDKPTDWELEVTNVSPAVKKDLELVYPRKLVPCN
jgi:hypothetical protein